MQMKLRHEINRESIKKDTNEGRHIALGGGIHTHIAKLVGKALIKHQALKMHWEMEV
jgi:hypothetical protein